MTAMMDDIMKGVAVQEADVPRKTAPAPKVVPEKPVELEDEDKTPSEVATSVLAEISDSIEELMYKHNNEKQIGFIEMVTKKFEDHKVFRPLFNKPDTIFDRKLLQIFLNSNGRELRLAERKAITKSFTPIVAWSKPLSALFSTIIPIVMVGYGIFTLAIHSKAQPSFSIEFQGLIRAIPFIIIGALAIIRRVSAKEGDGPIYFTRISKFLFFWRFKRLTKDMIKPSKEFSIEDKLKFFKKDYIKIVNVYKTSVNSMRLQLTTLLGNTEQKHQRMIDDKEKFLKVVDERSYEDCLQALAHEIHDMKHAIQMCTESNKHLDKVSTDHAERLGSIDEMMELSAFVDEVKKTTRQSRELVKKADFLNSLINPNFTMLNDMRFRDNLEVIETALNTRINENLLTIN